MKETVQNGKGSEPRKDFNPKEYGDNFTNIYGKKSFNGICFDEDKKTSKNNKEIVE